MNGLLYKCFLHLKWKLKIISLKIMFGSKIKLHWDDRISLSVKIRINDSGQITIGKRVELRENCVLNVTDGGKIVIEDYVFINDGCCINARESITIGSDTMFGQSVKLYDHDHDYRSDNLKINFIQAPIHIEESVWICSDVIILRGCHIGRGSVIAAGTIIKSDVDPNTMCYTKKELGMKMIKDNNYIKDNV